MISTPGITGYPGKCPAKNGSLMVTFLIALMCLPGVHSRTLSTKRNGGRCARHSMISLMSISATLIPLFFFRHVFHDALQRPHPFGEVAKSSQHRGDMLPFPVRQRGKRRSIDARRRDGGV